MDREFYESLLGKRMSASVAYFVQLMFWGSFIVAILFALAVVPKITAFVNGSIDGIITHFPEELTIKIEKGVAKSNVKEPYEILVPVEIRNEVPYDRFAVISTSKPITIDQFKQLNTLLLLTADSVYFKDARKIEIIPLSSVDSVTINKTNIEDWSGKISPILKLFIPISMLAVFLAVFVLSTILFFLYLFFVALLVWFAMHLKKNHIDYFQAFHLSLHLISFPYVLAIFFFLGGFPVPLLLLALVTIFMVFILIRQGIYFDPQQKDLL